MYSNTNANASLVGSKIVIYSSGINLGDNSKIYTLESPSTGLWSQLEWYSGNPATVVDVTAQQFNAGDLVVYSTIFEGGG